MNDTLKHAIDIFAYIIRGKGEMSGEKFGKEIRQTFDFEKVNEIN